MTKRSLIQTIPRVPSNLPEFLDALVAQVLNSRRLGAGSRNHFVERQPRQGLSALLEMVSERPTMNVTVIIDLIPLANYVEVYLETGMMGKGILRLMRGLTEKMLDQLMGREIADSISRIVSLESQNYGRPSQGSEAMVPQAYQTTSQTNILSETHPSTMIYCPACGLVNPEYARFCETCGTKLTR